MTRVRKVGKRTKTGKPQKIANVDGNGVVARPAAPAPVAPVREIRAVRRPEGGRGVPVRAGRRPEHRASRARRLTMWHRACAGREGAGRGEMMTGGRHATDRRATGFTPVVRN